MTRVKSGLYWDSFGKLGHCPDFIGTTLGNWDFIGTLSRLYWENLLEIGTLLGHYSDCIGTTLGNWDCIGILGQCSVYWDFVCIPIVIATGGGNRQGGEAP